MEALRYLERRVYCLLAAPTHLPTVDGPGQLAIASFAGDSTSRF